MVLDRGHVDIAVTREGDEFLTRLKDETALVDKKIVERPLDDVVLAVHDNALRSRPAALKGKDFDYLGKEKFFLLPQTQEQSIIWPGYNTQALDYKHYNDGKVTLNIKPVEMPEGAQVGLFTAEGFGKVFTPLINSAEGDYSIETTFASHTHTNWAFTKPGIYKLEVTYSATTREGKDISSAPQTLTVAAGDAAIKDCAKSKDGNEGEGTPKPGDEKPGDKPGDNQPGGQKDKTSSLPKLEGLWGLVLPVVLAIIFQGFLNFIQRSPRPNCGAVHWPTSPLERTHWIALHTTTRCSEPERAPEQYTVENQRRRVHHCRGIVCGRPRLPGCGTSG